MKKSRVLAMMLVVAMVFTMFATFVVNAEEITPPANSKVRVTEKTLKKTFEAEKVWDIWDTQGSFGTYTAGGNLTITGGTVPFVMLDNFGSGITGFDEMVVKYKTDSGLTLQFRERDAGLWSEEVPLEATNGEFVEASLSPADFVSTQMPLDYLKNTFKSNYDSAAGKYTSTAMFYMSSSNATIESITCYWYSYSSESTQERKVLENDFSKKSWGSWGAWTGGDITEQPDVYPSWFTDKDIENAKNKGFIYMGNVEGKAEDGVGTALHLVGGCTKNPPEGGYKYGGGQVLIDNGLDLTGMDAVRIRYCSTKDIKILFNRCYQMKVGNKLPESEVEIVKGLLGEKYAEHFNSNNECIKAYEKKEDFSSKYTLSSTKGVWKTIDIPVEKFGPTEHPFVNTIHTTQSFESFAPAYLLRFDGFTFGKDYENNYVTIGSFGGVWYEKLPTMASLSFENGGGESIGLDLGTTDVKVELKNDANIDIEDSVLVVALYEGNKLIDMDVKLVDTPAKDVSGVQTLSVTLDAEEVLIGVHKIQVMLWDSAENMNQITNLGSFDFYGYVEGKIIE